MNHAAFLGFLCLAQAFLFPIAASASDPTSADYRRAREIIDRYQRDGGSPSEHSVVVVYFTPSDREPAKDWQARISRIVETTQKFYDSEIGRYGLADAPLRVVRDANGKIPIHLVRGEGKDADYAEESGYRIRNEAMPILQAAKVDPERSVLLIFCNLMDYDGQSIRHHSPYYGGGSVQSGTAWQCDSEILDPLRLTDDKPIRDGQYGDITVGKHNSIFIGGVIHELGHALSLPHGKERSDQAVRGTELMGSGNRSFGDELRGEGRGTFLVPAHAMRMAAHPVFSTLAKDVARVPHSELTKLRMQAKDKSIEIMGNISADPPAHAVVAYFDPDGGSDYDAQTSVAVPDQQGRFQIVGPAETPGPNGEVRLVVCHANGNTTSSSYRYKVAPTGQPDLSAITQRLTLQPLVAAINAGNAKEAKLLASKLDGPDQVLGQQLVDSTLHAALRDTSPADQPESFKSISLSATKPESSKVGWLQPTFDKVPGEEQVLDVDGQYIAHGIYAHAPSTHRYRLGKKWSKLSGSVGLQSNHGGSVVFELLADGNAIWSSNKITEGTRADFQVDVVNTDLLELRVDDAGNGNGSDWGVWVEPQLQR